MAEAEVAKRRLREGHAEPRVHLSSSGGGECDALQEAVVSRYHQIAVIPLLVVVIDVGEVVLFAELGVRVPVRRQQEEEKRQPQSAGEQV